MGKVLKTNPCFDSSNFNFETRTELIQGPDLIVFWLRALYFSVFILFLNKTCFCFQEQKSSSSETHLKSSWCKKNWFNKKIGDLYLFFLVSYAFEKSQQFWNSLFLIGAYYFEMKEKIIKKVMNVSDFGNCLSKHSNRFLPIKLLTV